MHGLRERPPPHLRRHRRRRISGGASRGQHRPLEVGPLQSIGWIGCGQSRDCERKAAGAGRQATRALAAACATAAAVVCSLLVHV